MKRGLLLDTHALLWWVDDASELSEPARRAIGDADPAYVSVATVWELSIKVAIGKLRLARPVREFVTHHAAANRFRILPIELDHAARVEHLEMHHRDPFDRLLIAQAQGEGVPLVSADPAFEAYDLELVW